jgi:hypothetical protein
MKNLNLILFVLVLFNLNYKAIASYSLNGPASGCANLMNSCSSGPSYDYFFTGLVQSETYDPTTMKTTYITETIEYIDWQVIGGNICYFESGYGFTNSPSIHIIWDNSCNLYDQHIVKINSYKIRREVVVKDNGPNPDPDETTITIYESPNNIFTPAFSINVMVEEIGSISAANSWNITPYKYTVQTLTYSISPVCGATMYSWSIPEGWTCSSVLSGQNLTSITVTTNMESSGSITVVASKNGTCSLIQTYSKSISRPLEPISSINGANAICSYRSVRYSVVNNPYLTYNWTIPPGWIINGQGSSTVYITPPSSSYVGGGVISVQGSDGTSSTSIATKEVSIGIPTINYTRTTVANIEGHYHIIHPIGTNLFKSQNNITWNNSQDLFFVQYPQTETWYLKASNLCGTSPIIKINMHGTYCPNCPQ